MAVYNVDVNLRIDEEALAEEIQKDAYDMVMKKIQDRVVCAMMREHHGHFYQYSYKDRIEDQLPSWVQDRVNTIIDEYKDNIVDAAVNQLADRLMRTKAVKDKIKEEL